MIKQLEREIEKKFLKIRGWKNWAEYDKVSESNELDINTRKELINICIKQTFKQVCEEIEKFPNYSNDRGWTAKIKRELLKKFQGEEK